MVWLLSAVLCYWWRAAKAASSLEHSDAWFRHVDTSITRNPAFLSSDLLRTLSQHNSNLMHLTIFNQRDTCSPSKNLAVEFGQGHSF